jgi:release factor glutamine methyltransferase
MKLETSVKEALLWAKNNLREANIDEANVDALLLLSAATGFSKEEILADGDKILTEKQLSVFEEFIGRRKKNEPTFQIIGQMEINNLDLKITKNVLTPRLETEILIERASRIIKGGEKNMSVLDLGTGSGFIILSLAKKITGPKYFASDVSSKSLDVAKENASRNNLKNMVDFRLGNMFEPWDATKFDLVLANLPYIPETRKNNLSKEVVVFEPHQALFAGADGLECYEKFFKKIKNYLNPKATIICEIDETQGKSFPLLAQRYLKGAEIEIIKDLYGLDRVAIIKT